MFWRYKDTHIEGNEETEVAGEVQDGDEFRVGPRAIPPPIPRWRYGYGVNGLGCKVHGGGWSYATVSWSPTDQGFGCKVWGGGG